MPACSIGVLRREHEERRAHLPRDAVDGDAALLHHLEERRLGLRARAVDLVGEHDVREDRAGVELERALLLVVDGDAGDVAGQQVGGELDAGVGALHRLGERPRERRLAGAGHILEQDVTVAQHRREHELDHVALAEDRALTLSAIWPNVCANQVACSCVMVIAVPSRAGSVRGALRVRARGGGRRRSRPAAGSGRRSRRTSWSRRPGPSPARSSRPAPRCRRRARRRPGRSTIRAVCGSTAPAASKKAVRESSNEIVRLARRARVASCAGAMPPTQRLHRPLRLHLVRARCPRAGTTAAHGVAVPHTVVHVPHADAGVAVEDRCRVPSRRTRRGCGWGRARSTSGRRGSSTRRGAPRHPGWRRPRSPALGRVPHAVRARSAAVDDRTTRRRTTTRRTA